MPFSSECNKTTTVLNLYHMLGFQKLCDLMALLFCLWGKQYDISQNAFFGCFHYCALPLSIVYKKVIVSQKDEGKSESWKG